MCLIGGATGVWDREVTWQLLVVGHHIRAMTRYPEKTNVRLMASDVWSAKADQSFGSCKQLTEYSLRVAHAEDFVHEMVKSNAWPHCHKTSVNLAVTRSRITFN
jgi:hypothetical protein